MRLVKVLRVIVEISNIDDLTLINLSPHDKTITACCLCAKGRGGLICHNIAESLSWCLVGTFSEFFCGDFHCVFVEKMEEESRVVMPGEPVGFINNANILSCP